MPDFFVQADVSNDNLEVTVRRTDGEIRRYVIPMKWVRQWERFSLIKDLISFMVGENERV